MFPASADPDGDGLEVCVSNTIFPAEAVPAKHGSAAGAPSGQKWPKGQASHAVEPGLAWKEPAAQLAHVDAPV